VLTIQVFNTPSTAGLGLKCFCCQALVIYKKIRIIGIHSMSSLIVHSH
jgi:hypothetical protein